MSLTLSRLYAIVDQEVAEARGFSVPELATAFVRGGARVLQIRATRAGSGLFLDWIARAVAAARAVNGHVIVNNRSDLTGLAGAAGVHVGQDDLPVTAIRQWLPEPAIIGLSTHTTDELTSTEASLASYVAVGPIFETATKNTGYKPVGLERVRRAKTRYPGRPIVAIGGITLERAAAVIAAGASAVAVISDLVTSDPTQRVRDYLGMLETVAPEK